MRDVFRFSAAAIAASACVVVAPRAWACSVDADCPGGICVASACEGQPLGLSHIAEVQFSPAALTTLANAAAIRFRDGPGTNLCAIPSFPCPTVSGESCFVNRVEAPGQLSVRRSGT